MASRVCKAGQVAKCSPTSPQKSCFLKSTCFAVLREVLKSWKLPYNVVQIVVCTAITMRLAPVWVNCILEQKFLEPRADVEWWVFVYFCVKICDFGDTAFIVLEKRTRQLSLLH
eukprot:988771-Amphidinium_carterae.1